jgi:hypothetical protein
MARDAATFATAIEHLTPRGTVVNNRDPVRRRDHHIPGQQIRPLTRRQGRPAGALVTIAA